MNNSEYFALETRVDPSIQERLERLERQKIADLLNERLAIRPGPIELIQEHILPAEEDIVNAIEHGEVTYRDTCADSMSPTSISAESPAGLSDIESSIAGLNCTSPSPPPSSEAEIFSEPFRVKAEQSPDSLSTVLSQSQSRTVSNDSQTTIHNSMFSSQRSEHIPNFNAQKIMASCPPVPKPAGNYPSSQISLSQKENEKLIRSLNKKPKPSKPKVKKLKFHEYGPPPDKAPKTLDAPTDERYKRLLEQQTIYLRLQVMQQNAMMNALQGNSESMDAVTTAIESVVDKKRERGLPNTSSLDSMDGKTLDDLRVIDLRAQLKQRGLIVSGPKAKLIERLKAFECGQSIPSDFNQNIIQNVCDKSPSGMVPLNTMSSQGIVPTTNMVQVTTYPTDSGHVYQRAHQAMADTQHQFHFMNQEPPQQQQQQQQSSLQLHQVEMQPVISVAQPQGMPIEDGRSNDSSKVLPAHSRPGTADPIQLVNSHPNPQIQFQFSPPPTQHVPTIVLQPAQLQRASVLQSDKPKLQAINVPVFSQQSMFNSNTMNYVGGHSQKEGLLSQSMPSSMLHTNSLMHGVGQYQQSMSSNPTQSSAQLYRQDNVAGSMNECSTESAEDGFRSRASSEPASHFRRMNSYPWGGKQPNLQQETQMNQSMSHIGMSPTVDEIKRSNSPYQVSYEFIVVFLSTYGQQC